MFCNWNGLDFIINIIIIIIFIIIFIIIIIIITRRLFLSPYI